MGNDPEYISYVSYAICAASKLIADNDWPVLATKLPESNTTGGGEEEQKEKEIHCYKCKQWGHKANNPICPLYNKKSPSSDSNSNVPEKKLKSKDPWKYV